MNVLLLKPDVNGDKYSKKSCIPKLDGSVPTKLFYNLRKLIVLSVILPFVILASTIFEAFIIPSLK
jgi:hypothetical protein